MSLNSSWLDAFIELARERNFSRAAQRLYLTQSALSQRIAKLESELGTSLLVRDPAGLRLTDAGETLLRHCRQRASLEEDFLRDIHAEPKAGLTGTIRIGSFSTVQRSAVMPALDKLAREAGVGIELQTREMRDLPGLLRSGEVDYVLLNHKWEHGGIRQELLGQEECVLVESVKIAPERQNVYLDHDSDDPTTLSFLKKAGLEAKSARRIFLDEIYAIIDGVRMGWGRAVVPRHIFEKERGLRQVGKHVVKDPVYLHYYDQAFYPRLHFEVVKALAELCIC